MHKLIRFEYLCQAEIDLIVGKAKIVISARHSDLYKTLPQLTDCQYKHWLPWRRVRKICRG